MIDIQTYLNKLDKLQEYMDAKIDSCHVIIMWMDLQVCPDSFYIKNKLPIPKPYQKAFYYYIETQKDKTK